MPQDPSKPPALYFDEPRLKMSVAGRFTVRVVGYITYLVLLAATVTFIISGVAALRWVGVFLALFFVDRFVHRHEGDMPISELPKDLTGAKVNLARLVSPRSFSAIDRAFDKALVARQDFFLLLCARLFEFPQIEGGFLRLDVKPEEFKQKLEEALEKGVPPERASRETVLAGIELLAIQAFAQALEGGRDFIELPDFFSALAKMGDNEIDRLFKLFSIEPGDLERALIFSAHGVRRGWHIPPDLGGFVFERHRRIPHRIMNRAWTSRPTPTLDRYGSDLTDLAREGEAGFLIGHEEEYGRLVEILARPVNPNAMLVGEAGTGKETIVSHLAFAIVKDEAPKSLLDKRVVSLELQSLVAGAPPEELAKRLKTIVDEVYMAGNVIIYIPDIHNLVRTSGTAYLSAADALMPVIMNNSFPIVGATYPKEYKQLVEPRSDFAGAFEVVHVNEISEADAERLLTYEALILEKQAALTISFGAVKRAVTLAKKYFHEKFLPSSAEELLKSAVVEAENRGEKALTPDRVTAVAEAKLHIPLHEAGGAEAAQLLNLENIIHERLVGQDEAVKAVSEALREYRSGLTRKGGPIASFLFVGPTGVGKTELAKTLAKVQFGSEKMMTRFDMTEYQDKGTAQRFIGSPDGETKGALTEAVREKPYSLILLDEFEKAFPDVLNLFLQVLDDGRLTDTAGRTIDFTNTIIIATSNAHSDIINEALSKGETMTDIAEYLKKRLVDVFKPELLNRFSKIIIFRNLEPNELSNIVQINLNELAAAVKDQGIFMAFDPPAVARLAQLGYDPAFGARPLRRVVDEKIREPLSRAILSKTIEKGSRVKLVLKEGDTFDFVQES